MEVRQGFVPPSFFRERRATAYGNWCHAFWREALQNSVDAGASEVSIDALQVMSGPLLGDETLIPVTRVIIADNGHGMPLETIEDVFFQLGRSTKRDVEGAIGGFGTARMLLCFSQTRYEIRTGDIRVRGSGMTYTVSSLSADGLDPVLGCTFFIDIDAKDASCEVMTKALLFVTARSAPRGVAVTLNGGPLDFGPASGRRIRHITATIDGQPVHFAAVRYGGKEETCFKILVRQSGIFMFARYAQLSRTVIVDLDQKHAWEALSESREALRGAYSDALDAFVEELATESASALKEKPEEVVEVFRGEKGDQSIAPEKDAAVVVDGGSHFVSFAAEFTVAPAVPGAAPEVARSAASTVTAVPGCHTITVISRKVAPASPLARARARFRPARWTGMRPAPLLILTAWQIACARAVETLVGLRPARFDKGVVISPGFLFEPSEMEWENNEYRRTGTRARCVKNEDGSFVLAVNPVGDDGNIRFRLSKKWGGDGLSGLIAIAAHEAAHLYSMSHNETFANIYTEIMAHLDVPAVIAEIRASNRKVRYVAPPKQKASAPLDRAA